METYKCISQTEVYPQIEDNTGDLEPQRVPEVTKAVKSTYTSGVSYYIVGYLVYVFALLPVTFLTTYIEEVNTKSNFYLHFYERKTYYTMNFSIGKFIYWMALCIAGFSFVIVVNLKNDRQGPFRSRDGTLKDFKKMLVAAAILYFMAPIIFLRDKDDMQRGCLQKPDTAYATTNNSYLNYTGADETFDEHDQEIKEPSSFVTENDGVTNTFSTGVDEHESCHKYSKWEVFCYNYYYLLVFFLGLNFSHLDQPPLKSLSLTPSAMKKWNCFQWLFIIMVFVIVICNIIIGLTIFHRSGLLGMYLSIIGIILAYLGIGAFIRRKTHNLHFHHYAWAACLVVLCGYQNMYFTTVGALCSGIMIEGMSRWGFGPLWVSK